MTELILMRFNVRESTVNILSILKHVIIRLANMDAFIYASHGIYVNSVSPGFPSQGKMVNVLD